MEQTILLNFDFTYLNTINWRKAVCLMLKDKVEIVKASTRRINTVNNNVEIYVPVVLRLVNFVRTVHKRKAVFSQKNLLVRDNYTCQYCGMKPVKPTIDHVLPRSRGGKTSYKNCVIACRKCNNIKGNKTPEEAKMLLRSSLYHPRIIDLIFRKMKHFKLETILKDLI